MKNNLYKTLAASFALALALTLSCSDDKDDDPAPPSGGVSSSNGNGSVLSSSSGKGSSSSVGGGVSSSIGGGVVPSSSAGNPGKGPDIANYKTVPIGTQVWMAENLDYNVSGSKCYKNLESNCAIYGRLYDWATVMALPASCNSSKCADQVLPNHQGICPSGWHIPSQQDWNILVEFVNPTDPNCAVASGNYEQNGRCAGVGTKLKFTSLWDLDYNAVGTDDYGFSALPGGNGKSGNNFASLGVAGYWWSTKEDPTIGTGYAYTWSMTFFDGDISWGGGGAKDWFYSVRCIKNN